MKKHIRFKKVFITLSKTAILSLILLFGGFNNRVSSVDILNKLSTVKDSQLAVVLLNNQQSSIPFKDLARRRIASISFGSIYAGAFDKMLRNYAAVSSFNSSSISLNSLQAYSTIILQVTPQSIYAPETLNFIREIQKSKEVILSGFGNSTALQVLDEFNFPVLWNPSFSPAAAEQTAAILFGGIPAEGRLAQNVSQKYLAGDGYSTKQIRLRYSSPEEIGISSSKLSKIDDIVNDAIEQHATPSAVVMVVKDGNVIFNKAYGSHTYDNDIATQTSDIYDLASVTKIGATTMAAMKLYEDQKLDMDADIGSYLPDVQNSNKSHIPVRDVMLHQAGFVNLDFLGNVHSTDHTSDSSYFFPVKAGDHYYVRKDFYKDVMWPKMLRSPLPTRGQYVYSDISMFMMKEIIEHQAEQSLDKYVLANFYQPLGMRTAGFNPLRHFDKDQIVPTERDTYFRKALLHGYVHDSGASLADGVSGHAGLFASANDLAILNQMLLNGGTYGGTQYFKPETVELFTKRQSNVSRRGYGFDRGNGTSYPSRYASADTYGHTGYTGTCVWVDPKEKLVYIFLSNRVYPSASNKLNSLRVRPRIQDAIYEAIAQSKGMATLVSH